MTPPAPTPIRIVLADDHDLVRSGIRALLEQVDGVQVVAEARNGASWSRWSMRTSRTS